MSDDEEEGQLRIDEDAGGGDRAGGTSAAMFPGHLRLPTVPINNPPLHQQHHQQHQQQPYRQYQPPTASVAPRYVHNHPPPFRRSVPEQNPQKEEGEIDDDEDDEEEPPPPPTRQVPPFSIPTQMSLNITPIAFVPAKSTSTMMSTPKGETTSKTEVFDMPIIPAAPDASPSKKVIVVDKQQNGVEGGKHHHHHNKGVAVGGTTDNNKHSSLPKKRREATSSSHHHPHHSTPSESYSEKRKSGVETVAASQQQTPQRTKRTSHQIASAAITACFDEEDQEPMIINRNMAPLAPLANMATKNEPMPSSSSSGLEPPKRMKKDASQNVETRLKNNNNKMSDTSDQTDATMIMETPPGSSILVELLILYRLDKHVSFKTKDGCIGFFGPELQQATPPNMKKKSMVANGEDGKDGRSSSAGSNGRTGRGSSQSTEIGGGKTDKRTKDLKRKPKEEDDDYEEGSSTSIISNRNETQLREIDVNNMHDCHFEGCQKKFFQSTELEYHIAKWHKKRKLVYESSCTQTTLSISRKDASTETDIVLSDSNLPVLRRISPGRAERREDSEAFSDLSDDDPDRVPDTISKQKIQQQRKADNMIKTTDVSAAATLMGLAGGVATSSQATAAAAAAAAVSASMGGIGIHPSRLMYAEKNRQAELQQQAHMRQQQTQLAQQQQQQAQQHAQQQAAAQQQAKSAFVAQSPRANPQQPVPTSQHMMQGLPPGLQGYLPQFQQLLHPAMMQPFVNQEAAARLAAQSQQARTPSRQDPHKIHELAKGKEGGDRTRQSTPKAAPVPQMGPTRPVAQQPGQPAQPTPMFLPPQMMHGLTPQQQQQQQQNALLHMQQYQMARGLTQPQLNDLVMAQLFNQIQAGFPGVPQQGAPPFQQQQQQPPQGGQPK